MNRNVKISDLEIERRKAVRHECAQEKGTIFDMNMLYDLSDTYYAMENYNTYEFPLCPGSFTCLEDIAEEFCHENEKAYLSPSFNQCWECWKATLRKEE
jgi:hypothetical protein